MRIFATGRKNKIYQGDIMKRKLFLGIGGSGCKVAELYSFSTTEKDNVKFLGLDSDIEALERISNIPTVSLTEYNSLGNVIDKIDKETISDWFPCDDKDGKVGYFRSLETGRGANGWRMKGLVCLEYMLLTEEKRRELISALEWLLNKGKEQENAEEDQAEICVITSSCGGTGSSVAIALSMYIKRYVKSVYDKSVCIKALISCPEIYENALTAENKIKARANAYATFREINAIDLVSKGYNKTAKELSKSKIGLVIGSEKSKGMGLLFDSNSPAFGVPSANPFEKVYVFNRVVGENSISSHEQIMAKLLSIIGDDEIVEGDSLYSTISIAEVVYQSKGIIDYVVKRKTYEDLEGEWLWLFNATKAEINSADKDNCYANSSYAEIFSDALLETYFNKHNASRIFEYLTLNRVGEDDASEYKTDSAEITSEDVELYVKKLVLYAENLADFSKREQIKKAINLNGSAIEQVKLFDSKANKQQKSQKLYDFVEKSMEDMTKFHKQNIENLSANIAKILAGFMGEDLEISLEQNFLAKNGKHHHPVMALTALCLLYKELGKSFAHAQGNALITPYTENIIPKHVLENVDVSESINVAYNSLARPRLGTLLQYDSQEISKDIIKGVGSITIELDETLERIAFVFVEKMMHEIFNKVGELIEKYVNLFDGIKTLLEEHRIDVKIALLSDTSDTCTKMNVGSSEEDKKRIYDAFAKEEYKQSILDEFAGLAVYSAVTSHSSSDLFNVLCAKRKEVIEESPLMAKIKSSNIFRVLHDKNLLNNDLPKVTEYSDFKKALSLVALPADIDIKNDQEHAGIRMEEETLVSSHSATFAQQILGEENLTDQQAVDKYLFEQGNFEAKVSITNNLPANKIYSIRKINNLKPWFFKNVNDNETGATYYVDYLKALSVKDQQFTQMWNPHLVKERVKGDYLPFINPERQVNFEKGVYKAILYMLDKGVILVSPNQEKKDVFCYKEVANESEPIIFEGKQVLFENVYDLFGFARQNAELTMKYANLFDLGLEKECSSLEVNIYDGTSLPKIKQGIMKTDIVKILLNDMYASVRSINKIAPKSLLDFIYEMSVIDKYKHETVNFTGVINEILTHLIKYRTANSEESYGKLYLDVMSAIKAEYEKNAKQTGVKSFKQRKEAVFALIEK